MIKMPVASVWILAIGIAFVTTAPPVHAQGRLRSRLQQICGKDIADNAERTPQAPLTPDEAYVYGYGIYQLDRDNLKISR